jgi:hypothetical protein
MFIAPAIPPAIPTSTIIASKVVSNANDFLVACKTFQREQFRLFWYVDGQLRSKQEINEILAKLDSASPGQSAKLFQSAKALVDLILSLEPAGLGEEDWMPPYAYTIDQQTWGLRIVEDTFG